MTKEFLVLLNKYIKHITGDDAPLIEVMMLMDHIKIYLRASREDLLPLELASIVAKIYADMKESEERSEQLKEEDIVKSISDNGQSITFDTSVKTKLAEKSTDDILSDYSSLLDKYIIPPKMGLF